MKTSPNREQHLFLVAGGIILLVILVVVAFSMIGSPRKESVVETKVVIPEVVTPREEPPAAVFFNPAGEGSDRRAGEEAPGDTATNAIPPEFFPQPDGSEASQSLPEEMPDESAPAPEASPEPAPVPEPPPPAVAPPKVESPPPAKHVVEPVVIPEHILKQAQPTAKPAQGSAVKPPVPSPVASAGGGFVVQLFSLSSKERAEQVVGQVRGVSLPAFLQEAQVGSKAVYRVRVGPFADRAGAERAASDVKSRLNYVGRVMANTP